MKFQIFYLFLDPERKSACGDTSKSTDESTKRSNRSNFRPAVR